MREMLKSKIHRATVTHTDIDYEGSIAIDPDLMDAADILDHEKVLVLDINSGARFETYAIRGSRGSGVISVQGAAARLAQPKDKIIVMSFVVCDEAEARSREAIVVHVDERNRIAKRPTVSPVG
ncbi:MAG: aspartate 1-decarboxylase [Chloroflexi bacterium]|nr:MAG: aspartate 1-decarboxylase [Chloroflexota bacterium]